jgi:uncharacterized lipoprotein YddW (UPF0748 family)
VIADKTGKGKASREEIGRIFTNAQSAGFDTVLFQVRGNGTAYYESPFEPWADEIGGAAPAFDPLRIACDEGRNHGIAVHAWVNAMPGWRGDKPPENSAQLWNSHPHWFLTDQDGKRQSLRKDYYVILNPCLPPVREYLGKVCADIATRYPVQGIQLDYIRFLEPEAGRDYPHDAWTRDLFHESTGKTPDEDVVAWHEFRVDAVTATVREIRRQVLEARRDCLLSAAVFKDFEKARSTLMQDAPAWLKEGLVDTVFVMNYDRDDTRYATHARKDLKLAGGFPVIQGVGAWMHAMGEQTVRQMEMAENMGAAGVAVFAYSALFPKNNAVAKDTAEAKAQADRRRAVEAWASVRRRR